ncbi:MAG: hypothetical protein LBI92_00990 [Azoarcus sp.]|jgi:hypothetical protein|nr:hypothetical protein [Azoarcus sp.]
MKVMKNGLIRYLAILSAAIALTGCASFRNNEIAEVKSLPDVSQYQNKPSVFVEASFYSGEPDKAASEVPAARQEVQKMIGKILDESDLFSKYSFNTTDKQGMDYTLHIDIYNHGNHGRAAVSGVITGLSFFIIPGAATDHYTFKARLTDNTGQIVSEVTNKDSFTSWFGIWFLPVAAKTPAKAYSQTIENQLKAALKELVESGKLKYSQASPRISSNLLARR